MNCTNRMPDVHASHLRTGYWVLVLLMLCSVPSQVRAQVDRTNPAALLTGEEQAVRISLQPTYQRFEDGNRVLTETSFPVEAVIPFYDQWQLRVRGGAALAGGDGVANLSGLTDVQTSLSYASQVGRGSVILNASVNVPTGKQELTRREFTTAVLLSQNFYPFRVPSFGQGPGAGTGATWAVPVAESVVIGVGGSVWYRGAYDPVAGRETQYDPGEEARLTGGVDFELTPASAFSADVSVVLHGTDTVGGVERFNSGNYWSTRVQYFRQGDQQTVRLVGQYQDQQKSTLPVRNGEDVERQILPTQARLQGRYARVVAEGIQIGVSIVGRWYDETLAFEQKTLVTLGVESQFAVGDRVSLSPRVAYTAGDITGLEGGFAMTGRF